jgi:hypothetical protein
LENQGASDLMENRTAVGQQLGVLDSFFLSFLLSSISVLNACFRLFIYFSVFIDHKTTETQPLTQEIL